MSKQYRLSDGRVMNVFPETENAFNFSLKESGLTAELISQDPIIENANLQNIDQPQVDDSLINEEDKKINKETNDLSKKINIFFQNFLSKL